MAANVNANIFSNIINSRSRIIDDQQVILENYINQTRTNLLSHSSIELNDIDSYYDELEKKRDEVRELKEILNNIKKEINENVIRDYLEKSLVDHTGETFFSGVYPLKGGHMFTVDLNEIRTVQPIKWYEVKVDENGLSRKGFVDNSAWLIIPS